DYYCLFWYNNAAFF
nr:immunoglobulin light chain junction region [Macaca mulatta]